MVGMAPRRSGPDKRRVAERAASARSVAAASSSRARATTSSPTAVQLHVAVVAPDELHAQQRSSSLIPADERGLGHELRLGGDAEVQALGELDQVGELAQGEGRAWSLID